MKSGIYKIENLINNKVYIGQSVDIPKRWREHRSAAFNSNSKDYNMLIYKAFRKYGIENFSFEIIEEVEKDQLNEREIYWIEKYNSYNKGYNATLGGDESHIHLGKPIEVYDLNGKYITTYPNMTEAAKEIGISRNTIYGIIHGNRLSSKGYQFKLSNDKKEIKPYTNKQGGKIPIIQKDTNGNIINTFESAYAASRALNIDPSSITKCCKGKLKTSGSFRWEYLK